MTPAKLKLFQITWSATIHGTQLVKASDEDDAEDQFLDQISYDEMYGQVDPSGKIPRELESIELVENKKRKRK